MMLFCTITVAGEDFEVPQLPVQDNKKNVITRYSSHLGGTCMSIRGYRSSVAHSSPPTTFVHVWSLVCSVGAFSFHKLHGLFFDCLDALRSAVLLLILQVALEEELNLLHRHTQVDHSIKERPDFFL